LKDDSLLLRHVHPAWVQNDRPTSQVFKPTAKDGHTELSVYDHELISVDDSLDHYQNVLGNETAGVLAVSVAECVELHLEARSDPAQFKEHAVIDFKDSGPSQIKKKGKKLCLLALNRGWLART